MFLYDHQLKRLHVLPSGYVPALTMLGYTGAHHKVLSSLVESLLGLEQWGEVERKRALEARLHLRRRMLVNHSTVHDIRIITEDIGMRPDVQDRLALGVKYRLRSLSANSVADYQFLISTKEFDLPQNLHI